MFTALGSKLFQVIATMTYTRSHTRPSQKDLGCVVYPLNNKSLFFCRLNGQRKRIVTGGSIQVCREQMFFFFNIFLGDFLFFFFVQRNGVQSVPCTVHRGERTHWHQVFILWGVFITGSVTEKSFWQVWLPVRFSGVWVGGNLIIFCTLTGDNDHYLALRESRVQICLLTILFPVSSLHPYISLISRGPYTERTEAKA